jgi:hypothetical protein
LEYYREGGTEKHLRDIRAMLDISGNQIDRSIIREHVSQRHLDHEWAKVSG